ncbi:hypothetical protein [Streptomyces sp. NPDC001966]
MKIRIIRAAELAALRTAAAELAELRPALVQARLEAATALTEAELLRKDRDAARCELDARQPLPSGGGEQ